MIIAVLMTVHNRREKTIECLRRLFESDRGDARLVVFLVDDKSTDGTADAVRNVFHDVRIIQGNGSLFWNKGMDLAWKCAYKSGYYDFFLWLNDDTILNKDGIKVLIDTYHFIPKASIVVGSVCSTDGIRDTYGGVIKEKRVKPYGKIVKVDSFNGNIVLIPRRVCEKVGFMCSRFTHSFGDFEYGLRAKKMGVYSYITPTYIATCDRHDGSKKCFDSKYSLKERLKYLYSPLGYPPLEFFYLNKISRGFPAALGVLMANHVRAFMPWLWQMRK